MCNQGETELVKVMVDPKLSPTGKAFWREVPVDKCIAPFVRWLNEKGMYTTHSCCEHGGRPGSIGLHDGRTIYIEQPHDKLPECFFCTWQGVDIKKSPSGFCFVIMDRVDGLNHFKYEFDCPGSLQLHIDSMQELHDAWVERNSKTMEDENA